MIDLFQFTVKPDVFKRPTEIDDHIIPKLGAELEARIFSHEDPIVSGMGKSRILRVAAQGNALVIEPESDEVSPESAGIRAGGRKMGEEIENVEDLFSASEAPFRVMGRNALQQLQQHEELSFIDGQIRQVLEFEYPHLIDKAAKNVLDMNPSLAMAEERVR